MLYRTILVLCCIFPLLVSEVSAKEVVGWVEHAKIYNAGDTIEVEAKVDTGAKTSSLHCECITPITKNGKQWVSFSVKSKSGDIIRIEKPVLRIANIKRHFGATQQRYVIKLGICLGTTYRMEELTLVDRTGFNYPMLIGRSFLKKGFLVDPDQTFINQPSCESKP